MVSVRPWTGSWTGASDNPRAVSAISAITRVICARGAHVAWGRSSHNPSAVGSSPTRPTCGYTLDPAFARGPFRGPRPAKRLRSPWSRSVTSGHFVIGSNNFRSSNICLCWHRGSLQYRHADCPVICPVMRGSGLRPAGKTMPDRWPSREQHDAIPRGRLGHQRARRRSWL